jgi:hypothetical protein
MNSLGPLFFRDPVIPQKAQGIAKLAARKVYRRRMMGKRRKERKMWYHPRKRKREK